MISISATTSAGSGKTLPVDPIYTATVVVVLAIVVPLVVAAFLGRKNVQYLRVDQENLRRQRLAGDAKLRALSGKVAPKV
jgi:hypothetical protein